MKTPYYETPRFKLYLDDCLDVLADIPENTVDMIYEVIL
jgi:DNA modification methylase